jgi:uncharacterized membrane protein YcaP (DUF421 family)
LDPARIAVRALIGYAYLLFATRASGKRAVAQATPFDFVMALIVGDVIDDAIWAEVAISRFGAAVSTLCIADVLVKMLSSRFDAFHRVVAGKPRIVLANGVPVRAQMRRDQLSDANLAALLRLEDADKWKEVRAGRVELDGELSVEKHDWAEPPQRRDASKVREAMK